MTHSIDYNDLTPENLGRFRSFDEHETVRRFDFGDGVVGFIAVHNTNLGPGLGGCRMRQYDDEDAAIRDVLRLSRGMTYKNAVAGLPLGGGKAVIMGDPKPQKTRLLMEKMGMAVETLEGSYVTAEDSGTGEEDMVYISQFTEHVTGLPPIKSQDNNYGELGGNPSPVTALGCYHGLEAAIRHRYDGAKTMKDMHVAVQGIGAVGLGFCELMKQGGAKLTIADISEEGIKAALEVLGDDVAVVAPDEIYSVDADVFAPCAMGASLNDETLPKLKVDIIAGAANNQLMDEYHDQALTDLGISYVPDYVINSGGVICVGYEYFRKTGYNPMDFEFTREAMLEHVAQIGQSVSELLDIARDNNMNTGEAADNLAEKRFLEAGALDGDDESGDDATHSDQANSGLAGGKTLVQ